MKHVYINMLFALFNINFTKYFLGYQKGYNPGYQKGE